MPDPSGGGKYFRTGGHRLDRFAAMKFRNLKNAAKRRSSRALQSLGGMFFCCSSAADCLAMVTAPAAFVLLFYILFIIMQLLYPVCAVSPEGRVCNGQGQCITGLCYCNPLFSGEACTETAIPGWLQGPGVGCNGNGDPNQFIEVPEECQQGFDSRGRRSGPGWADAGCITYL